MPVEIPGFSRARAPAPHLFGVSLVTDGLFFARSPIRGPASKGL
jgi:hypothetical protein